MRYYQIEVALPYERAALRLHLKQLSIPFSCGRFDEDGNWITLSDDYDTYTPDQLKIMWQSAHDQIKQICLNMPVTFLFENEDDLTTARLLL